MAYGGWIRAHGDLYPVTASTTRSNGACRRECIDQMLAQIASLPGWSVKKAGTNIDGQSDWGCAQHTDGDQFAIVWVGDHTGGYHILPEYQRSDTGTSTDDNVHFAYVPAESGVVIDENYHPEQSSWILNGEEALISKFYYSFPVGSVGSGVYAHTWFLARGADLIFCGAGNSASSMDIDGWAVWGNIFESPLEHDPNDTEDYGAVLVRGGPPSNSNFNGFDCYPADQSVILEASMLDTSDYVDLTYTTPPPYNAVKLHIYNDLAEGEIYNGDGLKGIISDEVCFITPTGADLYALWNSGTHVHIGNGMWIGYDASNGAW